VGPRACAGPRSASMPSGVEHRTWVAGRNALAALTATWALRASVTPTRRDASGRGIPNQICGAPSGSSVQYLIACPRVRCASQAHTIRCEVPDVFAALHSLTLRHANTRSLGSQHHWRRPNAPQPERARNGHGDCVGLETNHRPTSLWPSGPKPLRFARVSLRTPSGPHSRSALASLVCPSALSIQ
jgi:hypothetical protein